MAPLLPKDSLQKQRHSEPAHAESLSDPALTFGNHGSLIEMVRTRMHRSATGSPYPCPEALVWLRADRETLNDVRSLQS